MTAEMENTQTGEQTSVVVKVNIFDQTYSLRSSRGEEHILSIAQLVDERMRKISEHTTNFDLARIAVLAALNIADELQEMKAQSAVSELIDQESNDSGRVKTQTWFEEIFDAAEPARETRERLSSQVSNKLQSLRREDSKPIKLSIEGEE
jgi:cell division protein ZapA (FtsZ GTPase activity inhibitor)